MSGQYFEPPVSSGEQFYDFTELLNVPQTTHATGSGPIFVPHVYESVADQHGQIYNGYLQFYQQPPPAQQYYMQIPVPEQQQDQQHQYKQQWHQSVSLSTDATAASHSTAGFPHYLDAIDFSSRLPSSTSNRTLGAHLSPEMNNSTRASRATSVAESIASSVLSSQTDFSREDSPSTTEMSKWAHRNSSGTWSCAYPGCTSQSRFRRGCDVRKHYKRHTKSFYCRHQGCPQAVEGGFSSKKDRARHEGKHNPVIVCEWEGCGRLFSRQDNMVSGVVVESLVCVCEREEKRDAYCYFHYRRIMSGDFTSVAYNEPTTWQKGNSQVMESVW